MSRADIQERARLLDQIDKLNALFGGRFHLDAQCGSCGGPLECDRDAICRACTDAMKIERLTSERDEARTVAINLHRALSRHESTPEIDESYGWLL